jgi:hypothetical protein
MKTTGVKFEQISQNEVKFTFKGMKFLLVEKSQGVYGLGLGVLLYELNGVDKKFIKTIGWTKSDNHGGPSKDCITSSITTFEACKQLAVDYLTKLLK